MDKIVSYAAMAGKYSILPCLAICLAPLVPASAQELPRIMERLTVQEGLSSNNINDLAQDDDGFLWAATPDGLNRYDGTEVVQFHHSASANSLPHNYVYCLKKLPGNRLAIGTQLGLSFYDGASGAFHNFYYEKNGPLSETNNCIQHLELDAEGNLWAASKSCIFLFDKNLGLKKVFPSAFTEADVLKERLSYASKITPLEDGNVLLYLNDGWFAYSKETQRIEPLEKTPLFAHFRFLPENPRLSREDAPIFPYARVFKVFDRFFLFMPPGKDSLLLFDESGRKLGGCLFPYNAYPYMSWSQQVILIDSASLLMLFHDYGLSVIHLKWSNGTPKLQGLSGLKFGTSEFTGAVRDQQGNWWMATTKEGLQKISPKKHSFDQEMLYDQSRGALARYEVSCFNHYGHRFWVATYGSGFFEIDRSSGKQWQHPVRFRGSNQWNNFIWNIRQPDPDTIWLGTQAGLVWYSLNSKKFGRIAVLHGRPSLLDSVPITTQFVDSRGWIWMGLGRANGICCYKPSGRQFVFYRGKDPNAYPLRYPIEIAEDLQGNLWFTSDASTSLLRWDCSTGRFLTTSLPAALKNKLGMVNCIWNENDSILWLASLTSGLIRYAVQSGSIAVYGHDQGLSTGHINSIYEDGKKRLWLGTEAGLSCFDQRSQAFVNFSSKDGLPLTYLTANFYFDRSDNRLYSGGYGKFFSFNPDSMMGDPVPPKPLITAFQINGKPHAWKAEEPVLLGAQQNDIAIQYTAVDLTNGPGTQYAYKLSGSDTGWVPVGRQRQINFSRLSPGSYTFLVRARSSNGAWGEGVARLSFRIQPQFTQTYWFYGLMLLGASSALFILYQYRAKQRRRASQIRSEISKNLHDEVGANLTNISFSSLLAQQQLRNPVAVSQLLERIYQDSQQVSEAMREIVWSINPQIDTLGDALPRMLRYASELLEARNIELQASIAPEVEQLKLSMQQRRDAYLIFKEAVNNLAKHSRASRAAVQFQLENNKLHMTIEDNGSGFDPAAPQISNGLKNMRDRALNHRWRLDIKSQAGLGTTVTLHAGIA